ncbi:MAG: YfdX family protein, partial [Xanthomonadaceae bacterium]|nr:YfdX family protein [Xanthomonadaceae bacterium]
KQARTLIQIIKVSLPTVKVRDHIWVAKKHLDYESTEEVAMDMIPIEADLTELEDFMPVEQAKKHIRQAKEHLKKGNKKAAKEELQAADAALIYTEADLPLAATEKQVKTAENFLAQNKLQAADQALKIAEDNVQYTSSAVFSPITQARNSLWQASKDYAAKNYEAAKVDLATAGSWLDKAAQSSDKSIREGAIGLKHELESLKTKVGQAGEGSGSALKGLWERSKSLAECEAEKVTVGWDKVLGESTAKADLVEAKLRVAYAETDQFIDGRSAAAGKQLDESIVYLDRARKTADTALKTKVDAISKEVKKMRTAIDDKGMQTKAHYEQVKTDLRQLIHDL